MKKPPPSPEQIVDPQTATLTNVEVLAFLTANPPRRPANLLPTSSARNWVPSPDLRDHNTVVKEIHNYIQRLSPHLLGYPRYVHDQQLSQRQQQSQDQQQQSNCLPPPAPPTEPTPLDGALRSLITRLRPYGLTKGEVLMIVNLGIGLASHGGVHDEQDQDGNAVAGNAHGEGTDEDVDMNVDGDGDNYGALALLDTVIEEREERISNEDVMAILGIVKEELESGEKPR
ncbi:hypothetical protein Egran_01835 [Elaphomyces granulatus]|uniref:DNA-directed RNA polymerase III subunit RPC9 n=1 Tax=Elaphomyces granulatus TaxID=519963 RepID=A0A232M262_9EURO|nr:hypothetical protein Egran_01835 [Elaphomyces granulatus]